MKDPSSTRMREVRQELGVSLDWVSFVADMPTRRVSLIERGIARGVRDDEKERIAKVLGKSVEEIFGEK